MAEGQRRLCWDLVFIVGAVALRGTEVLYFTGHGWFPVESSHRLMSHRPYMWNRGFVRDMLENSDRKYIFLSTPHGFPTDTETALVTMLSILHSCRSPCFASPFWDQSIFPLVFYFHPRGWWLSVSWALHALLLCCGKDGIFFCPAPPPDCCTQLFCCCALLYNADRPFHLSFSLRQPHL